MSDDTDAYGFIGEFEHNVDNKNRVILPSQIRDRLDDNDELILTTGIDVCLNLFPKGLWREFVSSEDLQGLDSDPRRLRRKLAAKARDVSVDSQGRIVIPKNLKEDAGITDSVIVVGNIDHVEFWSPGKWDAENEEVDTEELADTLYSS